MPDLQQAISAIKAGDKATGKQFLIEIIKANPNNENAWLWMTQAVSTDAERLKCLETVLKINPANESAKKGLEVIQQRRVSQPVDQPKIEVSPKPTEPPSESASIPSQSPAFDLGQHQAELQQEQSSPLPPRPLKSLKRADSKKCPYCAETIKAEATVCRFCGRNLTTRERSEQQPKVIIQQVPDKKKKNPIVTFLAAVGLLALLCVCFAVFSTPSFRRTSSSPAQQKPSGGTTSEYLLELVSMTDERSSSYITVHGQVKNISGEGLEDVEAVVEYYDANGNFVTSDSALIDYNPILAGQTSPFSVITRDNPAIKRYSASFKFLLGGTIRTKDSRK